MGRRWVLRNTIFTASESEKKGFPMVYFRPLTPNGHLHFHNPIGRRAAGGRTHSRVVPDGRNMGSFRAERTPGSFWCVVFGRHRVCVREIADGVRKVPGRAVEIVMFPATDLKHTGVDQERGYLTNADGYAYGAAAFGERRNSRGRYKSTCAFGALSLYGRERGARWIVVIF